MLYKEGRKYIGIYNGISFSHKKDENPAFCDNMCEPRGHHATLNNTEKRQMVYDIT